MGAIEKIFGDIFVKAEKPPPKDCIYLDTMRVVKNGRDVALGPVMKQMLEKILLIYEHNPFTIEDIKDPLQSTSSASKMFHRLRSLLEIEPWVPNTTRGHFGIKAQYMFRMESEEGELFLYHLALEREDDDKHQKP